MCKENWKFLGETMASAGPLSSSMVCTGNVILNKNKYNKTWLALLKKK